MRISVNYTIGEPVDTIPPVAYTNRRDDWRYAYQAARQAEGRWVPITMLDASRARNLASVAKKRKRMEAEARDRICFLRVVP